MSAQGLQRVVRFRGVYHWSWLEPGLGVRTVSYILEGSVFGPSYQLPPIFYLHIKFVADTLIGGGDIPPKLNSKQRFLPAEFNFRFQFRHVFVRDFHMRDYAKF